MRDSSDIFGTAPDGGPVTRVQIANGGARASVITWGASLQDFRLDGVGHSLALGGQDMAAYLGPMRYFGAIVGPVANRIAQGRMRVAGTECALDRNENGVTTLHGGAQGFGNRNWTVTTASDTSVTLALEHPDGLCGFPGNIHAQVTYALDDTGALTVTIRGETDRQTVFAPAFHGYWNLDGQQGLSAHKLTVFADDYLPVDAALIPLGAPAPVAGTAFDYRTAKPIQSDLDHNFCLSRARGDLRPACRLQAGDLELDISTTEVGLQVYSGGGLDTAPHPGHTGAPYGPGAGIAIEPQFWPDTPNHPDYPSAALLPDQPYTQVSRFAVTRI